MTMNNGYAAYQNSKIMTASPAELTLMLYEGAIKFCNIAIMGIEENNIQKAHTNIVKVENIIEEFQATLIISIRLQRTLKMCISTYRNVWLRQT